jgi:hypothetical protein
MDTSAARDRAPENTKPLERGAAAPSTEEIAKMLGMKDSDELKVKLQSTRNLEKLLQDIPESADVSKERREAILDKLNLMQLTYESKATWLEKKWNWVKRNKWKIAIGALLVGAGAAAGYYYWPQLTALAAGAGESVREWALKFLKLDVPKVDLPAAPDVSNVPGTPGGVEIAPPPRPVVGPETIPLGPAEDAASRLDSLG